LGDVENYLRDRVLDREGSQSPTWTVQPAEKKSKKKKEKETGNNRSIKETQ
jgi:hypothetical protein